MQGKQLRKLETELWKAADQLRANSKLTATEYSIPVLGLIFLRHAFNRFDKVRQDIEKDLPSHPQRGKRAVMRTDFEAKNAMFLPDIAQFDYLVNQPDSADIGTDIDNAMKAIEAEYPNLTNVLPKNYSIFSGDLLRELLRIFNKDVLRKAEGDLFGKIYEFFLNKFAMTGAQEGGEFFTPLSLVQTIVNIIEPDHGTVLDPACGSAGMFVQTGYFIESEGLQPDQSVTFYGQEKTDTNTKLAKMNLAVHGLEGKIEEGNTFYEDKHNLVGKCDFVMANPPFNVDGVDKGKDAVKKDPRLVLNKTVNLPKNDNANYLWIQYFYNYLTPKGRAGFVMASSASDAGHSEKDIRAQLVKTGAVDVMVAVGNNFFYTRSLPCTLWFYDKAKEQDDILRGRTLMLDARKIYRKVTSKVNDFSPEQLKNLVCIVNLYRGNTRKFDDTVQDYLTTAATLAQQTATVLADLQRQSKAVLTSITDFATALATTDKAAQTFVDALIQEETDTLFALQNTLIADAKNAKADYKGLESIAHQCKALRKPQDKWVKNLTEAVANAVKDGQLNKNKAWKDLNLKDKLDALKATVQQISGNPTEEEFGLLHETDYFWRQAHWLKSRFREGSYQDVEGLCKVVSQQDIEAKDWSLSPGRYVGVDTALDEHVDYEERLREIHIELVGLNEEAVTLANLITENFKTVGI